MGLVVHVLVISAKLSNGYNLQELGVLLVQFFFFCWVCLVSFYGLVLYVIYIFDITFFCFIQIICNLVMTILTSVLFIVLEYFTPISCPFTPLFSF